MKRSFVKYLIPVLTVITVLLTGTSVMAAGTSPQNATFFPAWMLNILSQIGVNADCTAQYINSRVRLALFLVGGGLILLALINIIIASFRYITSEGKTEKVKKAHRSILGVFMGIASLFISILGMVLVFEFLGVKTSNPVFFQTCISAVGSQGCQDCMNNPGSSDCQKCENGYNDACNAQTNSQDLNSRLDKAGLSYCH